MINRPQIEQAIAGLKAQKHILDESILETALAALQSQMSIVAQQELRETELHGERRRVTVMFADISGFTAMSEKLDPEEVRSLINLCFERLGNVVDRYDGHIDKFIGDEIMALFGAPVAHENDPERALRAALDMMKTLQEFNMEHAAILPKPLALHFGLNSGLVIAGGIGTSKRRDYSVMGDTVNLAARLEGLSETGEILVGEDTYRLTAPLFEFETLDPVQVKGKEKPVQVYRLIRAKALPGGQIRGIEGRFSPLVGRTLELEVLKTLQAQLHQGRGGLVSIIAEAGLGKSRLVIEMSRANREQWAQGHALSHAENASYLIVRHLFRSLLRLDLDASPAEIDRVLQTDIELLLPDSADEVYPYLAYLMEIPLNEKTMERVKYLEGEALRQRIWQAAKSFIEAKSQQNPLVLVCDDLHWADPSSLELLRFLLPLTETCQLLMLLMYRPRREKPVWTFHEKVQQQLESGHTCIELPPLTKAESDQLLSNLLRQCQLPEAVKSLIVNKADGNPFYLEEVIRSLLNSGAITLNNEDADCIVTVEVEDITIPDTLQGVIMSRIDQLDPDAKYILQMASVMGRDFLYEILSRVVGQTSSILSHLQNLESQELVVHKEDSPQLEYSFKHVFTQESIYQSLLRTDRREFHQKVGEAMEFIFAKDLDEQALLLSYHFEHSEDRERALKYLRVAADHASTNFANQEACTLYSRVLSLLDKNDYPNRWEILAAREQTLDRLGQREQQATDLTLMQTVAELIGDTALLAATHNRRAVYFDKISEYQASDEAAAVGLRMAQRISNARLEAQSLNSLALAAWRRFDYREVQKWANQALQALQVVGAPTIRINSLLHLGRASYRLGQYDTALKYIAEAQAVAKDIDNREQDALADLIFGWIYQRLGDYDQAAQHFELMLEKRRQIGDKYGEATALSHLGWLAADQKAFEQGLIYCQAALTISCSISDRENEAYALAGLALNYEQVGEIDLAVSNYEMALTLHRQIGATTLAVFDQVGLARIALTRQDLATTRDYVAPVLDWILAGNAQQFWDPWTIYLSTYQVLTALGEIDTAHTILVEAHTVLHQRAREISSETLRHRFLEEVAVNREIRKALQAAA